MDGSSAINYPLLAREVNYHLVASLALQLWDMVITSKSEMEHIWPKPWSSVFKWLYLFLRYFSLAIQIFHQFAVPYLNSGKALKSNCFAWFVYTALIAQFQTTTIEFILAVRVYALFNRSRRIAIMLGSLMTLEYIILVIIVGGYFHRIPSIPYCILSKPPNQIIYHAIAVVATQSTLLCLSLIKHLLARRAGWGRAPLVSLLIRDGTATYFIICVIFLCIGSFCQLRDERTVIMFFWLISVISSCGCRLIVNMQRLAVDEKVVHRSHITSEIEVEYPSKTSFQSI
ncbi:hypothetical protein DEU56DRAFT_51891 [Suillus clintonianus]|uniref:uncharacterized protein n=1 Tax=Suillus clintonianus TaxID=1904413 RepID=UPI001B85D223|nr:uncharacterized protein DEU56DRAFT_51891 [Suillus clintonianus]KAG2123432.1 hypothetical protein DEU56DRAFT_51891 [Suillus clintonianus]